MKAPVTVHLALLGLLLVGGSAPLLAETAYVPVANLQVEGVQYETVLWVTNAGDAPAGFSTRFIPFNTDGTPPAEPPAQKITVSPGGTFYLRSLAPAGSRGMLELTVEPGLVAVARIEGTLPGGSESLGATVPVLTSKKLIAANQEAVVQGLERSALHKRSSVGFINLGDQPAECSVAAFQANGANIQSAALLQIPPFGMVEFYDALNILGLVNAEHVHLKSTCDQPSYPFATISDVTTGEVAFVEPSSDPDLGSSIGPPPGDALRFTAPGVFHAPRKGNAVRRLTFPVPEGAYASARAQLDVFVGPWATSASAGSHNIFWMVRDARNGEMFGYINVRGPNSNQIWFRHGFHGDVTPRISSRVQLTPGETYRFDYLYDAAGRRVELVVRTQAGAEVARLFGVPNVGEILFGANQTIVMDFGFQPGLNPAEPPTFGWEYRDLVIDLVPLN